MDKEVFSHTHNGGYPVMLNSERFRKDKRQNITKCIVKLWYFLPEYAVMVTTAEGRPFPHSHQL